MRIISQPDLSTWCHEFTCFQCKSKLMATADDLYKVTSNNSAKGYGGEYINLTVCRYVAYCAVCDFEATVDDSKIPFLLKKQADKRGERK